MASARQVAANRENGLKGGVKTEEGKAVSRLNARKHSIFVTALTAEDSDEVCGYEDQLIAELRPAGRIEEMLVEKIALTWLRIQRCARAEAEYHISIWQTPKTMKLLDLYDTRLTNQFLKLLHEIERLQLLRKGKDGAVASQDEGEASRGAAETANEVKPPATSAEAAPEPAATETSCPASQPALFVPSDGVAQPPSAVRNDLSTESQPRAAVPHTEQAPAETSQDVVGQEAAAQTTI